MIKILNSELSTNKTSIQKYKINNKSKKPNFSCNKENNKYKNYKNILKYFTDNNDINNKINIKQHFRNKSVIIKSKNFINEKIDEIHKNNNNIIKPYYRKIYSNEYLKFENQITKIPHYIKKYKEDDITFTKNKILPEIKWLDYDNDVLTSDGQKKGAIKKELKNLGETIKRIQNNGDFFKYNVSMYKLSQKYPKIKN